MSLETKRQRGSVVDIGMPWRQWHMEPDGVVLLGDRLSLLKLCSRSGENNPTNKISYRASNKKPHYVASDLKPHYRAGNNRPHYAT